MSEDEKYNGYANYETWAVNLWLTNDESAYMAVRQIASEYEDSDDCERAIKDWVEDNIPDLPGFNENLFPMGLFSDLILASLKEVDWSEIVESLKED